MRFLKNIFAALLLWSMGPVLVVAATGSWNGVAFTALNGVVQTSWNGTGISCATTASISIVQAKQGTAVATSATITLDATATAGNLLVVAVTSYTPPNGDFSGHAMADNIGSTTGWTFVAGLNNGTGTPECVSFWYKKNIPAGITTLTCTGGLAAIITIGIAHEVAGCSTTTPFTSGEFSTATGATTINPQTGTVTNATASSIFFAVLTNNGSGNPATMTINGTGTVGTWNLFSLTESQYLNGNSLYPVSVPNIIVSSSTAEVHGWTTDSQSPTTILAAFH